MDFPDKTSFISFYSVSKKASSVAMLNKLNMNCFTDNTATQTDGPHNSEDMIKLLGLYYMVDSLTGIVWYYSISQGLFVIMACGQ